MTWPMFLILIVTLWAMILALAAIASAIDKLTGPKARKAQPVDNPYDGTSIEHLWSNAND